MRQIIFHEETKTFHYILENDFMIKQIFLIWLKNVDAQ